MAYDQYLVKITTIGIVFLVVLGFLNYHNLFSKPEADSIDFVAPSKCDGCYGSLETTRRRYSNEVAELKRGIEDRNIEIRILKERVDKTSAATTAGCEDVDRLKI